MGMSAQEGQYVKCPYGIMLHTMFVSSHSGITYDRDGNPLIRTRKYNSPPGMSGGGGGRKRGQAVNDELPLMLGFRDGDEVTNNEVIENISIILGFGLGSTEQVMKAIHVSELELRQAFLDKGYSTKKIDRIISRTSKTGGIARIGGRTLFWGQFGYNILDVVDNPTLTNTTIRTVDSYFSYLATYRTLKGMGIAGVYFLSKESVIITMKSLDQGLVKPNTNIRYSPGLAPSPVIWDW